MFKRIALMLILFFIYTGTVSAQSDYGVRVRSRDGQFLLPVASKLLGSTDKDHIDRESINSWDISASVGTPVFAAAAGVVKTVGCDLFEKRITANLQGYGCSVQIDHGGGIVTQYAHCKEETFFVGVGQQVTQASPLCRVGRTGMTSWPHVHFTILRNGSPIPIASVFDISLMRYCKFCHATNDPNAPVSGVTTTGVATSNQGQAIAQIFLRLIATQRPDALATALAIVFSCISLVYWLSGTTVRVIMLALVAGMVGAGIVVFLFMPTQAAQTPSALVGDKFLVSYQITRGREGVGCDNYIVRTLNGVTQWTYNRYRRERGLPTADVCSALTEGETRDIYYRYYWLESGSAALSIQSAVTAFDHAINAGPGEAKRIIAACGDSASCLNRQRIAFYQGTNDCARKSVVCGAWLRRVQHIMKVTGI